MIDRKEVDKKGKGKRKTQDPCEGCYLHKDKCMCAHFPSLSLKTRVVLVTHYKEFKRTTNTGRLALKCLLNSEMRVRGVEGERLDLSDLAESSKYQTLLLYPSKDAAVLAQDFIEKFDKPIQLIVPDGNWRQASKVHTRHSELKNIPRVMIKDQSLSESFMRVESKEEGMATLQAIAYALKAFEGGGACESLLEIYNEKLMRTLKARQGL